MVSQFEKILQTAAVGMLFSIPALQAAMFILGSELVAVMVVAAGWLLAGALSSSEAQTPGKKGPPQPAGPTIGEYRSQHFFMYTDLPPVEAKELLERLETMLGLISEYWGRPSRGIIEMYVAKDVNSFPPGRLPYLSYMTLDRFS